MEVANFCAAMDTLIDQNGYTQDRGVVSVQVVVAMLGRLLSNRVADVSEWHWW